MASATLHVYFLISNGISEGFLCLFIRKLSRRYSKFKKNLCLAQHVTHVAQRVKFSGHTLTGLKARQSPTTLLWIMLTHMFTPSPPPFYSLLQPRWPAILPSQQQAGMKAPSTPAMVMAAAGRRGDGWWCLPPPLPVWLEQEEWAKASCTRWRATWLPPLTVLTSCTPTEALAPPIRLAPPTPSLSTSCPAQIQLQVMCWNCVI